MKQYNGEKAIISLTSWKARINTVCKTLFSLIDQCPGFHIVLVLSEEEFPKKEDELPENLKIFIDNDLIEVLWVYKNYKSFKKVLFTMDKYRNVPVISADDGCIYVRNYAEELYQNWLSHPNEIISEAKFTHKRMLMGGSGCGILFPPRIFIDFDLDLLDFIIDYTLNDDLFYSCLAKKFNKTFFFIHGDNFRRFLPFKELSEHRSDSIWNDKKCSFNNLVFFQRVLA